MCHPSHGQKQQCSKCHKPHGEESTRSDCFVCHKGHTPRDVKYSDSTPTNLCLECHEETGNNLLNSDTKHSGMNCVKCHPNHAQIPSCMDCHGTPHTSTTECVKTYINQNYLFQNQQLTGSQFLKNKIISSPFSNKFSLTSPQVLANVSKKN